MKYPPLLTHGFYGEPPQWSWFAAQTACFVAATGLSKGALALLMATFSPQMDAVGKWVFSLCRE